MANEDFAQAQKIEYDEFYTRYSDIQQEVNAYIDFNENVFRDKVILLPCDDPEWSNFTKFFAQNFERFGIKKLISTSYAIEKKTVDLQPSLFETEDPKYNPDISKLKGKIFTLDRDTNKDGKIDINDLEWEYLEGDGDFRSKELQKLSKEADVIITNPPFSLLNDFILWLLKTEKKFIILGNMNAITYKEIFPYIQNNKLWIGATNFNRGMYFRVPESFQYSNKYKFEKEIDGEKVNRVSSVCWYTNLEHGKRHEQITLMTLEDNLKFNNKLIKKLKELKFDTYPKYDNYEALEIPYADAIPSDYDGVMGVPISFIDKYNPEQFEIMGLAPQRVSNISKKTFTYENSIQHNITGKTSSGNKVNDGPTLLYKNELPPKYPYYTCSNREGYLSLVYARILIKHKINK